MTDENITVAAAEADDWDDIDLTDGDVITDDAPAKAEPDGDTGAATEADRAEEAAMGEPAEDSSARPEEKAEADQSFTLKYLGEEKTLSRDETIAYAQKGMDYDRIRGKLGEQTAEAKRNAAYAEFVASLAADAGMTTAEFIDSSRASALSRREGISLSEAQGRIRLERRERELEAREAAASRGAAAETDDPETRRRQFVEFFRARPDVKAEDIPGDVFRKMREGVTLTAAYALYENSLLKSRLDAAVQNAKNAARSAGSASSSGKARKPDEFDAMWYDET